MFLRATVALAFVVLVSFLPFIGLGLSSRPVQVRARRAPRAPEGGPYRAPACVPTDDVAGPAVPPPPVPISE